MKARSLHFIYLTIVTLFAFPAFVMASPASTSPYYTDTVNNYVQDQVSKDMEELNSFLCLINAMAPDQLVNEPDYIAMVNLKACSPNTASSGRGEGNTGTGSSYLAVQLKSSRVSNTTPMLTKIWLDDYIDELTNKAIKVPMYASASQAPSKYLPYGVFRLDYCKQFPLEANCNKHIGYIDATNKGLAFYTRDYILGSYGEYYDEFALKLSANTTTNTGSGIVIKTNTNNSIGSVTTTAIVFAHNPDFFYRDDGVNPPQCFDRAGSKAEESVWRYGLYYAADTSSAKAGDRFEHQSNYTIKYNDTTNNKSYLGYIGYYGYWFPNDANISSGASVYKVNYDTYPPTEKQYTFLKSGGKLTKYSTFFLKLSDMDKSPFSYYLSAAAATAGGAGISPMISGNYYYIYWDKGTQLFYVYSHYNSLTHKYEVLPSPVALNTASFVLAVRTTVFGLSGDSPVLGGYFKIQDGDIANLVTTLNNTRVITQTQDVVYPKDYAALNAAGGLKCIADCPTRDQIDLYNADQLLTTPTGVSPFVNKDTYIYNTTTGENTPTARYAYNLLKPYYLDPASGNLRAGTPPATLPGTGKEVLQTALNNVPYSGKMVLKSDIISIISYYANLYAFPYTESYCITNNTCFFAQSDIDFLAYTSDPDPAKNDPVTGYRTSYTYYEWSTGANSQDQMAFLIDGATTLEFYPPLPVTFTVPNSTKYGSNANRAYGLQYVEFGNLWGIYYKCVDLRNNLECVYYDNVTHPADPYDPAFSTNITPYDKRYWTAEFSIPFDETLGVVTTSIGQGSIAKGTQFLVKALDKETRLSKVPIGICTVQGLGQNISIDKLPSADLWIDPSKSIGTKTILNPLPAPRVIHGVKQY